MICRIGSKQWLVRFCRLNAVVGAVQPAASLVHADEDLSFVQPVSESVCRELRFLIHVEDLPRAVADQCEVRVAQRHGPVVNARLAQLRQHALLYHRQPGLLQVDYLPPLAAARLQRNM